MSDIIFGSRPMCDSRGCESVSNFHGFGRDVCWSCYSRLLTSGGFYSLTSSYRESTMRESNDTLTTKESCGRESQMTLQW
jgi:hypothetical protein